MMQEALHDSLVKPRLVTILCGLLLLATSLYTGRVAVSTIVGLLQGLFMIMIGVLASKKHALTGFLMLIIGITSLILGVMLLVFNMIIVGSILEVENILALMISFSGILVAVVSKHYFEYRGKITRLY